MMRCAAVGLLALASACGGSSAGGTGGGGPLADRPYGLDVPSGYVEGTPVPLVVLLHGYTSSGAAQDAAFGFAQLAEERTVLVAHPDGTMDGRGNRFWNATDWCCNFDGSAVDDVAYLLAVIEDVKARYTVDARRVFLVGHSNGAFMAHRLACDAADVVAGFVALAGDPWSDASRCRPTEPVAALQIHGDADASVPYDGVTGARALPSAPAAVAMWAARNGCAGGLVDTGQRLDVDRSVAGAETRVARWACTAGAAELWTIQGGGHLPAIHPPEWGNLLLDWLLLHPKP